YRGRAGGDGSGLSVRRVLSVPGRRRRLPRGRRERVRPARRLDARRRRHRRRRERRGDDAPHGRATLPPLSERRGAPIPDHPTNEEIFREYARASAEMDLEALAALRHPDWSVLWPQCGERVMRSESDAEIVRNYPGGRPRSTVGRIVGGEDRWVVTGANTVVRVAGTGDAWWGGGPGGAPARPRHH